MENSVYYTFSTIAQSLAGAVAFLGAFVLFRLQAISDQLRGHADLVRQPWPNDQELQRVAAAGDYEAFLKRAKELVAAPIPGGWKAHQQACLDSIASTCAHRASILRSLKRALVLAAVVMVASVAVLTRAPQIGADPNVAVPALAIGASSFALSVLVLGRLVFRIVRGA